MMNNFKNQITELLEVDNVDVDDILKEFDAWDSLTALSIIALCDSDYGIKITANELSKTVTIKDLFDLLVTKGADLNEF
jgi:acyl carrier protein